MTDAPYETVDPGVTTLHCEVYMAIKECWETYGHAPSQFELQRACKCSTTSIQKAFASLRKKGYIVAPRGAAKACRPTDMNRDLRNTLRDPWEELSERPKLYWVDTKETGDTR